MDKKPKIIIVGAGISGCMAALAAVSKDVNVSLFTIMPPCRSPSSAIQSGFNAALDTAGENDSPEIHAADTMAHGGGLADPRAVERMCRNAPALAGFFDRMGVLFDRSTDGLMALSKSPGSTHSRTARAGDATGHAILSALDGQVRWLALKEKIRPFEGWEFLSPVCGNGGLYCGIVARNLRNSEIKTFASDAAVICTGNMSRHAHGAFVHGALLANPDFPAGGLWIDGNHATSIGGLFAAGDAACQYHGRTALQGNEIPAKAHGGRIAGSVAAVAAIDRHHRGSVPQAIFDAAKAREEDALAKIFAATGDENAHIIGREFSALMAGIPSATEDKLVELEERLSNARSLDTSQWENAEVPFMRALKFKIALARAHLASKDKRREKNELRTIKIKWTSGGAESTS